MNSTPALFRRAVLACAAAAFAAALPAHAETFSLGAVTGPTAFTFDDISHTMPFEDVFTFSVASGTSFAFSAFFNTPLSNRFWINDLDGRLERGGTTVIEAGAETVPPPPFPHREVTFATQTLVAGDYALRLFGTPTASFQYPRSSYGGTFTFAALAAPVSEPGTMALMALGTAALAATAWRQRRG